VSRRFSDWPILLTSLPVLLAMLWLQGREAGRRNIDNDELEHLNGAYFTTRGETLYGSIYENHPPLTAVLLQPVVRSSDIPQVLIVRGRWVMLALSAVLLAAVARFAWYAGGWPSAILAATLLLAHPFYFDKFMEVRPDVPAIVLLVVGFHPLLYAASTGRRWMRRKRTQSLQTLALKFQSLETLDSLVLKYTLDKQEQSHDRERHTHDRADNGQANEHAHDHQNDTEDHRDETTGHFHDDCQ